MNMTEDLEDKGLDEVEGELIAQRLFQSVATGWRAYHKHSDSPWRPLAGELLVCPEMVGPRSQDHRPLYALLPPSYPSSERRYPVVYCHDGQNLFDPAMSYAGSWRVDHVAAVLACLGREAIFIGVPNLGERRITEYSPFFDLKMGGGRADAFVKFLVDDVKGFVDDTLRTLPGRENTGMIGSSMGGLISLYGFVSRPDVFSFVGALSPSLFFAEEAMLRWLEKNAVELPEDSRVFVSAGTREVDGETRVERVVRTTQKMYRLWRLERLLIKRGLGSQNVRRVTHRRAEHREQAWSALLPRVMRFLLPKQPTRSR